ncbi:hypothetical protein DAEQUDRAFT_761298 [Daedalea quercina L-15889]|uniref:Cytochrome c oxidase subunit 8, mitochondrial n=1 Tax=Daedalea quercina L-15889 TaxID=1314783 RepID=A0A165U5Z8_9APHY|nr:hypothetical protein DAEQUDRAFT_761298 [Daedalea quercina L-15889]
MTLLARASPALRQSLARSSVRTPVRFAHGHPYTPADLVFLRWGCTSSLQAVPFSFKSKRAFGMKITAYLLTGAAIPVVAAYYQLWKSGAA